MWQIFSWFWSDKVSKIETLEKDIETIKNDLADIKAIFMAIIDANAKPDKKQTPPSPPDRGRERSAPF